ncbi:uncharacterized protein [Glycine max]|uniref:uncharacterized protein n=1 Tax=Glycine max TaxID=3847 RepID=UPI0003DEBA9A|nr:uncharacterized protein LOC100815186 [Glycine max]|eukprot:XP_006577539.1 uncharacterized protein LOC100815186 [Glycine max]
MTRTSMRAGNADVYGYLEPQSIQRFDQSQFESKSYLKNWMQNSKRDAYLGAYLNGAHWQMVVILPNENVVIWFCSLHNRPDNYLKGIINSALKGLDDTQQSKSKPTVNEHITQVPNVEVETEANTEVEDTRFELTTEFAEVMDHIPLTQQSQPFLRDLSTFPDAIQKDMLILSMFWGNPLFC